MNTKTLKDLFLDELMDMYDAEQRIARSLPKMTKDATRPKLQAALQKHLKETLGQISNLEQVFESIGEKAKAKTCEATVGLLEEADEIAAEFKASPAIDAALIAAVQKVEHYEIASYGCLHEWVGLLGNQKAKRVLKENLDQEKTVDDALTELARAGNNEEARDGETDTDSGENLKIARKATGGPAARRLQSTGSQR